MSNPFQSRQGVMAIGLAALSLLLSGYAVFHSHSSAERDKAQCTCDEASLRSEIASLRNSLRSGRSQSGAALLPDVYQRITGLEDKLAKLESRALDGTKQPISDEPVKARHYVRFDVPNQKLSIRQAEDGSIAVTNTDPSLTGQVMTVSAHAEDGSVHQVTITVPPP